MELLEDGDWIDYESLLALARRQTDKSKADLIGALGRAVEGEWGWRYEQTAPNCDLRAWTIGTFTWLHDATMDINDTDPENRLVGLYGTSVSPSGPRDKARMAGFPLVESADAPIHRGHAAGHSLGGPDEGYNLFPQDAVVNRGGEWRRLERYCAARPGTFLFVRCLYRGISSRPSALEFGVLMEDWNLNVRRFNNVAGSS